MFKSLINSLHHAFARSSVLVKFFLLLRNQCNCIIAYHIADSPNADKNGENFIIDFLAKDCSVILDVGANKGNWTEYFLSKNSFLKAFLLEPSHGTYEFLKKKFQSKENIVLINKALADKEGKAFFFEEPGYGETSSLVQTFSNSDSIKREVVLTTIDALGKEFNVAKIDFLKIDTEGYDLHVLKGSKEYLQGKRIKYIQFEYNSPWATAGSTLISAINFLKEHDYETFLLKKDGLYQFNYKLYGEFYRYSNFLALPEDSMHLIKNIVKGEI